MTIGFAQVLVSKVHASVHRANISPILHLLTTQPTLEPLNSSIFCNHFLLDLFLNTHISTNGKPILSTLNDADNVPIFLTLRQRLLFLLENLLNDFHTIHTHHPICTSLTDPQRQIHFLDVTWQS